MSEKNEQYTRELQDEIKNNSRLITVSEKQELEERSLECLPCIPHGEPAACRPHLTPNIEYTFFSGAHGTFSIIDHILGHKTLLHKVKRNYINYSD